MRQSVSSSPISFPPTVTLGTRRIRLSDLAHLATSVEEMGDPLLPNVRDLRIYNGRAFVRSGRAPAVPHLHRLLGGAMGTSVQTFWYRSVFKARFAASLTWRDTFPTSLVECVLSNSSPSRVTLLMGPEVDAMRDETAEEFVAGHTNFLWVDTASFGASVRRKVSVRGSTVGEVDVVGHPEADVECWW